MPLTFEEPEEKKNKSPGPSLKKKEESIPPKSPSTAPKTKSTVGSGASASHRRVFSKSSQYFASFSVIIIKANDLPAKKTIQPYCQIYIGRYETKIALSYFDILVYLLFSLF